MHGTGELRIAPHSPGENLHYEVRIFYLIASLLWLLMNKCEYFYLSGSATKIKI